MGKEQYFIFLLLLFIGQTSCHNSVIAEPGLSEWWETVDLENQDRKNRLNRLADIMPGVEAPRFFQETIPRQKLGDLPVDIPVLRVVFKNRVFFDTGKSTLRPEANAVIDLVAESLRREPPDVAVFVAGHTDSRGSEDYNHNLSVDRANTVARALMDRGIGLAAIWRVGFGESIPSANNATDEGMAQNRRVEFLFAAKPAAVAVWLSQQAGELCSGATADETRRCKRSKLSNRQQFVAMPVVQKEEVPVLAPKIQVPMESDSNIVEVPAASSIDVETQNETVIADISRRDPIIIDIANETVSIPAPQI